MATVTTNHRSEISDPWGVEPLRVRLSQSIEEVAAMNRDLRIEQKANGEFVMMAPAGLEGSSRNLEISYQLMGWTKKCGGKAFDCSAGFHLPDGSTLSPDASWIAIERWNALSNEERKTFAPICPDFVIELRSESDRLTTLQDKMKNYLNNGIRLGWLIDPLKKQVRLYRTGTQPEVLSQPESVSGEEVLPGFVLDLRPIWNDV